MDDMASDDPASQYVHLGSIFFAIAIVVWTSVAVWLCYSGPPGCDLGESDANGSASDGGGELSDSVIGKVAHGFAELLLEGKDRASAGTQCDARTLDLSKLEELLTPPSKGDCKSGGCTKKGSKGLLTKVAGSVVVKETGGHLSPPLAGLNLGGSGGRDGEKGIGGCDLRAAPSPARAPADPEGRGGAGRGTLGTGSAAMCDDGGGGYSDKAVPGAGSATELSAFREQLREKIASSLGSGAGRKAAAPDDLAPLGDTSGERGGLRDVKQAGAKREVLEDFVKQLLHPPNFGGLRGKLAEVVDGDDKEGGSRPGTMLSMAEHAREIGNKYLQDRHFAAAAHCYEVACLLCPAGSSGPGQLAAYHCNCALACLELGRYGDAINEGNAALVLTPPKHLAVKALYRLAVAHANLKNAYEARRCLKRCLELDPLNEYARVFLARLGEEEEACVEDLGSAGGGRLTWIDPPKKVQCLGAVAREKARGKRAKQKNGLCAADEIRLDREAGLWHTVARHNSKLYILGGWPDAGTGHLPGDARAQGCKDSPHGGGAHGAEVSRGCDELHVLDIDSFELRQLSGPNSKPPHPCCCHTATMVGSSMYVFGGLGPPVDQPPLVMVFDVLQGKWRVPSTSGIPPRQRQGHTANAVQCDRHLCVFGGIEPTGEQRTARVYGDAHLLDLQSYAWRKLDVGGRRPPARFGHSATNLPGSFGKLLVVGGRDHLHGGCADPTLCNGFTGLHILDTERRAWTQQSFSGTPPAQAFYHSACILDEQTLLVLASGSGKHRGAGGARGASGAVPDGAADVLPLHLLDLESWRWSQPRASGVGPAPRVGHAAAAAGGRVYIFGGLVRRGGQNAVDKGVYVLETTPPQRAAEAEAPQVNGSSKERAKGERVRGDAKATATTALEKHAESNSTGGNHGTANANCSGPISNGHGGAAAAVAALKSQPQPQLPPGGDAGGDGGRGGSTAPAAASRDERIEMMLRESGFDGDLDDATELSFEELLEQEKAFFRAQSEKLSFPRAKDGSSGGNGKRNHRF